MNYRFSRLFKLFVVSFSLLFVCHSQTFAMMRCQKRSAVKKRIMKNILDSVKEDVECIADISSMPWRYFQRQLEAMDSGIRKIAIVAAYLRMFVKQKELELERLSATDEEAKMRLKLRIEAINRVFRRVLDNTDRAADRVVDPHFQDFPYVVVA